MARYRPIDVRLWTDRRFLALSDPGKLLWVFLLTTPSTISIPGVIVGGEATLAETIGWSLETYQEVFAVIVKGGMRVRAEGRVVWLGNALKYQPPTSPNQIKGWAKTWDDVPEGELKDKIWEAMRIACKRWSRLFLQLFPKTFGDTFAQTSLEGFASGSGSGSETRSGTGSGSGSLSEGDRSIGPESARDGTGQKRPVSDPPRQNGHREPDTRKQAIVNAIGPAHAIAFARAKAAIGSTALGPSMVDRFEELRELLDALPSLEGALLRCEHVLAVREAEAVYKRTMQFFGPGIWKRQNFEKALTFEVADVNGSRIGPQSQKPKTGLGALLDSIDDDSKENVH